MSFLEMSPLAVVAILVVIVYFVMSSSGGRKRAGKSSLTGSLSKELQSIGKSVKKTTGKGGLGKITNNKMLVGILVGFGLCWAYGKFRMEGFSDEEKGKWLSLSDTQRGELCSLSVRPDMGQSGYDRFSRMWTDAGMKYPTPSDYDSFCLLNSDDPTRPRTPNEFTMMELPDLRPQEPSPSVRRGSATTGVIGEDTAQQLMDQGGVDSILAGLRNTRFAERAGLELCNMEREGLTPQEQSMYDIMCRTGEGGN